MPLNDHRKPYKPLEEATTAESTKYTHIGVQKPTQKKIALLAIIRGGTIYSLVGEMVDKHWQEAKEAGLVTDAMLNTPTVEPSVSKGGSRRVRPGASA